MGSGIGKYHFQPKTFFLFHRPPFNRWLFWELMIIRRIFPPPKFNANTYYSAARGCLTDCSLRVEMTCPDSINVIYIETFSMNGKPMEIHSRSHNSWPDCPDTICRIPKRISQGDEPWFINASHGFWDEAKKLFFKLEGSQFPIENFLLSLHPIFIILTLRQIFNRR